MSTFGGFMPEFPQIRVDNFRQIQGVPPPLACFLSHVHSDHLAGLESLKSPFVYCSAATRALLIRLERYPHRINFEKGILESRKQHYKHLKNILKPIPLHTPTHIELSPYNKIQVTLFDANHCTGAVMFLIEGVDRAVLYTGDIRAEPWFVNTLARNPLLIEYASNLKKLDCIYLDTSFTDDVSFPTKAEGLKELLQKVSEYPPNTEFHFAAWTFGYEEVWMALSQSLNSQVHVDNYKLRLYQSLSGELGRGERVSGSYLSQEGPILTGHRVGNTDHPGILTLDTSVRLHSCENFNKCSHLGDQTVWIRPIITRTSSGQEIGDIGIGGGGTDLNQRPELELESDTMIRQLMALFVDQEDSSVLSNISRLLLVGLRSTRKVLVLNDVNIDCEAENLSLEDLTSILTRSRSVAKQRSDENTTLGKEKDDRLPKVITFPYSRHSSYPELRDLVKLFKPMDVYPCTVNKAEWHEGVGIRALFGDLCCGHTFRHDQEMYAALLESGEGETRESWNTTSTHGSQTNSDDGGSIQKNVTNVNNIILGAQRTNNPPELICTGKASSENGIQAGCTVPDVSNMCGTTSTFVEADSDPPYAASPQLTRLPLGSEPRYIRRREDLEECSGSSPKRARVCLDSPDTKPRLFNSNLELPRPENVMAPTKSQAVTGVSYYDVEDDVHRCQACGRKIRRPSGECTGCGIGKPAYHEAIDSTDDEGIDEHGIKNLFPKERECHPRISNVIEDDIYNFVQSQNPRESTASLRDGVSAYDSTSIEGNEYERNNFIDDPSIRRGGAGNPASGETDYKVLYEQISSAYNRLEQEHHELTDDHEELRRNVLGSDYNDSDEAQLGAVGIEVRDPPLSEAVLSLVQGDSQSSVISDQRLMNRAHAVLAAPDDWYKISLMSTGDNHTEEEPEL